VALSIYDELEVQPHEVNYIHYHQGGKFQGVLAFLKEYKDVIEKYDYFWLFEDDLFLPFETLRRILSLLSIFPFELAAPALSYYSYFTWPITVQNTSFMFRCTDFVEVMMPIMSRDFLQRAAKSFDDNFSAWGHEWLWRKILQENGDLAAIFDCATVTHGRPFGSGTLHRNRPRDSLDPKEELAAMQSKYGLDLTKPFRNVFGVTRSSEPAIVVADRFLEAAIKGYRNTIGVPNDALFRCMDTLIGGARPTLFADEVRRLKTFQMVDRALPSLAEIVPDLFREC
jgi:hypothetical protein